MTGSRLTGSAPPVGDCKCELEPYAVQGLFELNCSSPWVGDCKYVEMPEMPEIARVERLLPAGWGLQEEHAILLAWGVTPLLNGSSPWIGDCKSWR